jgi:hypothetical protein
MKNETVLETQGLVCKCGHGLGWHRCKKFNTPHGTFTCPENRMEHKSCMFLRTSPQIFTADKDCLCQFFYTNNLEYIEQHL